MPAKGTLIGHRRKLVNALVRLQRKTQFLMWSANRRVIAQRGFKKGGPPCTVKSYTFRARAKPQDVLLPAFVDLEAAIAGLEAQLAADTFNAAAAHKLSYTVAALQEEIFKFSYGAVEFALMAWEVEADAKGAKRKRPQGGKAAELSVCRMEGPLFVAQPGDTRSICANDVNQGYIGDCYFMATMAAVAHTDPHKIRSMVRSNGDGTYTVTIRSWITGSPTKVRVSDHVLQYADGRTYYGHGRAAPGGGIEKWPAILERAFAKWKGGYDDATNTGAVFGTSTESAMERFGDAETHSGFSAAKALQLLKNAQTKRWPVSVAARSWDEPDGFRQSTRYFLRGEWESWRQKRQAAAGRLRVAADSHVYTLIEVKNDKICLRNPWGSRHPLPMTAEEFILFFDEIVVGKF